MFILARSLWNLRSINACKLKARAKNNSHSVHRLSDSVRGADCLVSRSNVTQERNWLNVLRCLAYWYSFWRELESLWCNIWLIKMHIELTDYCLMTLSQLSVSGKMTELHLLHAFVVKTAKQPLKVISLDLNVNPFYRQTNKQILRTIQQKDALTCQRLSWIARAFTLVSVKRF